MKTNCILINFLNDIDEKYNFNLLLNILLESLYIFGDLDHEEADIIIYTNNYYKEKIFVNNSNIKIILDPKELPQHNNIIKFDINSIIKNKIDFINKENNDIMTYEINLEKFQDFYINYYILILTSKIDSIINNCKEYINNFLVPIIKETNEELEGNIFMHNNSFEYTDDFNHKRKNISNILLNKKINNILEIGFNSGFSALIMLLSNPKIKITCVDIGNHKYTIPCYEKLKETFGDRIELIIGDSVKILPKIKNKYDLIHIDGSHDDFNIMNDIINSYHLSNNNTIIIMDDYNCDNIKLLWDKYTDIYGLKNLALHHYGTFLQDIKIVSK